MPMIKIDGQEYDVDSLPIAAKQQLQMIQFVEAELARIGAQTAVLKTAQLGYARALKEALNPTAEPAPVPVEKQSAPAMMPMAGETLKFN